ncbi:MAG: hypothetical protein IKA61_07345 [Clostridia bacterium]|nr:hypothetical protein [Clostridia bacterium]
MNAKKIKKREEKVTVNLDYLRRKADVYAIGALIREIEPMQEDFQNDRFFVGLFKKIKGKIKNKVGQMAKEDFLAKEDLAKRNLKQFEDAHTEKELALASDTKKLKKFINKKLFRRDKYSLRRLQFGLNYAISNNHEYQCYEDSLNAVSEILFENPDKLTELKNEFVQNYKRIEKKQAFESVAGDGDFDWGEFARKIKGAVKNLIFTMFSFDGVVSQEDEARLVARMSQDQLTSEFAVQLTLLEECKKVMTDDKFKVQIKKLHERVSALKAEAENDNVVKEIGIEVSEEKFRLCEACLARISEISVG